MTGSINNPRVNVPTLIEQGDTVTWQDNPFTDDNGAQYSSGAYSLVYTLAGGAAPLSVTAAVSGSGWLTTLSAVQTSGLVAGAAWWQAQLQATGFALTIARGQLTVQANLALASAGYSGLSPAAQALATWKAALAALSGTNGGAPVDTYRIGDREMKYRNIPDVIEAIAYWQTVVTREQTADSIAQNRGNPKKLYARFPNRS